MHAHTHASQRTCVFFATSLTKCVCPVLQISFRCHLLSRWNLVSSVFLVVSFVVALDVIDDFRPPITVMPDSFLDFDYVMVAITIRDFCVHMNAFTHQFGDGGTVPP